MTKIIPIESTYSGVKFRSRLEARWAALFDYYSILWVYEPDVFNTPSGRYLPDFLLPEIGAYVEVKPGPLMFDLKAIYSVAEQTRHEFLILDSPVIQCRAYALLVPDKLGPDECHFNWCDMIWCMSEKYLGKRPKDGKQRLFVDIAGGGDTKGASVSCPCCEGDRFEQEHFKQIRSMRFENGRAAI